MTVGEVLAMDVGMEGTGLPIACSLTGSEFQERRSGLLRKVKEAVLELKELQDGYAYRFPSDATWINELANLITIERECCRFLQFVIRLEPGDGPIWLELTGTDGSKEFLSSLFG